MEVPKRRAVAKVQWQAVAAGTGMLDGAEPVWEDVRLEFMQKCIEQALAQLPDIYGWQVVKIDRDNWYRRANGFKGVPLDYVFTVDPGWADALPSAERYQAPKKFALFCPVLFFPQHFRPGGKDGDQKLKCVFCHKGDSVKHKGWADGARNVVDVAGCYPLLARRYTCVNCPESSKGCGKGDKTFTSVHPGVLTQLYSPILDNPEMFVVRHKVCLTQTVLLLTTALAPHMSFAAMADAIGSVQYTKYLLDARAYMSHCSQTNPVKGFWKSFGKFEGHIIARRTLSDAYMTDCERRMPVQMEYMESLSGEYLMVDHTFWACKHVSVQVKGARPGQTREMPFNALWGAGNEHGQLLVYLFTYSKALDELREPLLKYKTRCEARGLQLPKVRVQV